MSITNTLYRLARASATTRAARRGPKPLARRLVSKPVYRAVNKQTGKALRKFLK